MPFHRFACTAGALLIAAAAAHAAEPQFGATLQRDALIAAVLDRNPTIESARQAWQAALARAPQVTALDDPMLSFSIAPLSIGQSSIGTTASISQRLPWPGKLALRGAVAAAEADAAASDLENVKLQMAVMASTLYDDDYAVARSREINDEHLALIRNLKSSAEAQYVVGKAAQQDPLQAEVQLAHLLHQQVVLGTRLDVVRAQINEMLHRPPEAELPPPVKSLDPPALPAESSAALQEAALRSRPVLAAAAARIRASQSSVDLSKLAFKPDFDVMTERNSMWMTTRQQYMVGVGINLPIERKKREAAVTEAAAKLAQAESDQTAIVDRIRSEVAIAYRKADEARQVLRIYHDRLLPAARDQNASARAGFIASRNDFQAVMNAENNLRTVELDYQIALTDVYRSLAGLDSAVGRVPHFSMETAPSKVASTTAGE